MFLSLTLSLFLVRLVLFVAAALSIRNEEEEEDWLRIYRESKTADSQALCSSSLALFLARGSFLSMAMGKLEKMTEWVRYLAGSTLSEALRSGSALGHVERGTDKLRVRTELVEKAAPASISRIEQIIASATHEQHKLALAGFNLACFAAARFESRLCPLRAAPPAQAQAPNLQISKSRANQAPSRCPHCRREPPFEPAAQQRLSFYDRHRISPSPRRLALSSLPASPTPAAASADLCPRISRSLDCPPTQSCASCRSRQHGSSREWASSAVSWSPDWPSWRL